MHLQKTQWFRVATADDDPTPTSAAYDGSVSKAVTFYTAPIYVADALGWLAQIVCPSTGSPVGDVTVEISCDEAVGQNQSPEMPDDTLENWIEISFYDPGAAAYVSTIAVSGAAAEGVEYSGSYATWVRIKWTRTSGTIYPKFRLQKKGVS